MSFPEKGSIAMVTGAAGGIGAAIAQQLVDTGCHVILTGRSVAPLQALATRLGEHHTTVFPTDLTDDSARHALARLCPDQLDILVHCAGLFLPGPADGGPTATLLNAINVTAPMALSALCLPAVIQARGQIVFVNSTAALSPAGHAHEAYATSKRALKAAADSLRPTLKGRHVRVLNIFPGRTDTAMLQKVLESEAPAAAPPALLRPDDIAQTVLYSLRTPRRLELTDIVIRPENA